MCWECAEKLVFAMILVRSWHFPHNPYGPFTDRSGVGNRFVINCPGVGAWLITYWRSKMCVHFDPCGPLGPVPPNSRLSSLLWQSVQRIRVPMARAGVTPSSFSINARRLGWGSALLRSCITGWLEVADNENCGIAFQGSTAATARTGR